jgi:hypothetical protein
LVLAEQDDLSIVDEIGASASPSAYLKIRNAAAAKPKQGGRGRSASLATQVEGVRKQSPKDTTSLKGHRKWRSLLSSIWNLICAGAEHPRRGIFEPVFLMYPMLDAGVAPSVGCRTSVTTAAAVYDPISRVELVRIPSRCS